MEPRDLEDVEPKPGFADRVMNGIATRPLPRPSLWRRLLRPRSITIEISPVRVLGLVLALATGIVLIRSGQPRGAAPAPARLAAAASTAPVLIRFVFAAPNARAVSLAGDFNGWRSSAAPAQRGADGVWRVTLPIPPGSWRYSFVVDGNFVDDPQAEAWREDGFGGRNAVVRVD